MNEQFRIWWAQNHPADWWASERGGSPLPHEDRQRVRSICEQAFFVSRAAVAAPQGDAALAAKNRDEAQKIVIATEYVLGEQFNIAIRHELADRITAALNAASLSPVSPSLIPEQNDCGDPRPDDGSKCAFGFCPRPRAGCSLYCVEHHASECTAATPVTATSADPTYDQVLQAITDIQEARESHVQWAAHLRDGARENCQGCTDHAAHIGEAGYHDEWIAKYDNVIYVLAHAPFNTVTSGAREVAEEWFRIAQETEFTDDAQMMEALVTVISKHFAVPVEEQKHDHESEE